MLCWSKGSILKSAYGRMRIKSGSGSNYIFILYQTQLKCSQFKLCIYYISLNEFNNNQIRNILIECQFRISLVAMSIIIFCINIFL